MIMLFIILLLEGFITISVEVLTIRQLTPFYGGSVLITSIIIGIFLLFLALGYWRGGAYHKDYFKRLTWNFTLSLFWVGIGLSYVFVRFFYYVTVVGLGFTFLFSLTAYLLLILAPVVYWMGQTVPLATNLFNQEQRISRISGRALFLSTMGSFLGALMTSLLFFQYLGVAWTIVINCFLLLFLIFYIAVHVHSTRFSLVFLIIFFGVIGYLNLYVENKLFQATNNYGNYRVIGWPDFKKTLEINHSASSQLTLEKKGFAYIEYIKDLLFNQLKLSHKKILVIGAGGFTFTAEGQHGNEVTYVDIDPDIIHIAEEYFLEEPIQGKFVGLDARQFLQQNHSKWDVILSDVYSNQTTSPPMLLTREYFQSLKKHLEPGGLMLANIIADPLFRTRFSQIIDQTVRSVFPYCFAIPADFSGRATNIIYICPNEAQAQPTIYQDDLNTSTIDYFKFKSAAH